MQTPKGFPTAVITEPARNRIARVRAYTCVFLLLASVFLVGILFELPANLKNSINPDALTLIRTFAAATGFFLFFAAYSSFGQTRYLLGLVGRMEAHISVLEGRPSEIA